MTRGRRRGVLLALGACLVGLGGWLLLTRSEGRLSSGRVDEAATQGEEPPSELDAPSLAAGAEAAAARRRPRAAEESALSDASTPAVPVAGAGLCTVQEPAAHAALVVTVEALESSAPPSREIELRLVDPWGRTWASTHALRLAGKQADEVDASEWFPFAKCTHESGGDARAAATWRLEGLAVGAYAVSAGTPGLAPPGWLPVFVTLSEEHETAVRLRPMLDAERGVIEVALLRGGSKIQGTFVASIRGRPFSSVTASAGDDARFELPVGETVSIEVTAFDAVKTVGRPPAQSVVVPAGTPARVEFRVPTLVGLRLVAPGVASRGKTTARAFLWRIPPGQWPVYADSADGDLGEGIPFTVSPGPYGVQLTDVRGYLPSWSVFVVSPEADPNLVAVEPGAAAEGAQLCLQEADGAPAANESVWIGRLGGASPSEVAVGNGKSDADGMVSLATLPDGDYRIAVRGQHWHAIELRAGAPVRTLRLPPRSTPSGGDAPPRARISGLVVAPGGGSLRDVFVVLYDLPDGWGRYTGFDPTGAFTFGDVTPGDVTIEVPWSQLRTQVHEPARVSLRIAPGNHRFVVIEAWRVQHGTR